ncbi:hypothetical protein E2C01_063752 [Portunus trituberculatus]|uniref:Uncharacterized protein n=1 Tax=Portunus trituberculatus TaxID=210409 RepID=A0A5B7HHY1_PORTR|nr:hypothetical protein [Portunus trituberculatus]
MFPFLTISLHRSVELGVFPLLALQSRPSTFIAGRYRVTEMVVVVVVIVLVVSCDRQRAVLSAGQTPLTLPVVSDPPERKSMF